MFIFIIDSMIKDQYKMILKNLLASSFIWNFNQGWQGILNIYANVYGECFMTW